MSVPANTEAFGPSMRGHLYVVIGFVQPSFTQRPKGPSRMSSVKANLARARWAG